MTPAGVEVISLGGLYGSLKINDLINGANQPRNIALAGLLERLGFVHNLGNGIQQIMQAYDDGIDAPQLRVATASVAVILPLLRVELPPVVGGARTDADADGNTGANGNGGAAAATGRVATKYRFPGMPLGRLTHRIDGGEAIDQLELRRPAPDVLLSVRSLSLTAAASAARPITAPDLQPDSGRLNRSELEPLVLAFMIEKGLPLKRIEIQEPLNLSKSQANYALRGLTEAGKVRRIGHSRATRYLAVAAN